MLPLILAGRPKGSPTADHSTAVIKTSLTVLYPKSWRSGGANLEFANKLPPLIVQNKQRLIKPHLAYDSKKPQKLSVIYVSLYEYRPQQMIDLDRKNQISLDSDNY